MLTALTASLPEAPLATATTTAGGVASSLNWPFIALLGIVAIVIVAVIWILAGKQSSSG